MPHGIVNYSVRISIACITISSFFLVREIGFYLYTENVKSVQYISMQRDLYYSIYVTCFYVAMPLLFASSFFALKFKWGFLVALLYTTFVFDSYFTQHPMWGGLLISSYFAAFLLSVFLVFLSEKIFKKKSELYAITH